MGSVEKDNYIVNLIGFSPGFPCLGGVTGERFRFVPIFREEISAWAASYTIGVYRILPQSDRMEFVYLVRLYPLLLLRSLPQTDTPFCSLPIARSKLSADYGLLDNRRSVSVNKICKSWRKYSKHVLKEDLDGGCRSEL
jgi:hypothetical protein